MLIRAITKGNNNYKIYFENGKLLKLESQDEDSYQGISTWGDYWGTNDLDTERGEIQGDKIINYHQLPSIIKSHVEKLMSELD